MAQAIPDADAWRKRAAKIRANILRGAKLEHLPPPCPLNPVVHSRRELDGYNVANVAFDALPGFRVTGNLYTPSNPTDSMPGILIAHGHWENGRRQEPTQKLAASLARMGATLFAWDMLGFGESTQCDHKHPEGLRIQTYSSMRALDFLLSQPGVDAERLAITGASGGGTQTFILAAIDDRIDVSVPVVQVSAHFYGGCTCESGMPIHVCDGIETNNVEIAASFAPKPQLLVSDGDDWTANTPQVEFPYIRRIYGLLGAEDNVENAHFPDEGHDYGPSKRKAVYKFLAKHLKLNLAGVQDAAGEIDESFVTILDLEELAALDGVHAPPGQALTDCQEVVRLLDEAYRESAHTNPEKSRGRRGDKLQSHSIGNNIRPSLQFRLRAEP
ncbi:MAG: alpha/beta hydrolase family protein [Pirellulales bacterium]